ncbi:flagellar protein FliS [Phycicoccus sp. HDW14]|nr:flagellar export chaperone FliS [Phycicoccus sp. HDW14]QIM21936.1 flagellar protein FliS [Phycicoccus sp. HDW14]
MTTTAALRRLYTNDSVTTASPGQLVVLLYNRLVKDLNLALVGLERRDIEGSHRALRHAQEIVAELSSSLDTSVWPEGRACWPFTTTSRTASSTRTSRSRRPWSPRPSTCSSPCATPSPAPRPRRRRHEQHRPHLGRRPRRRRGRPGAGRGARARRHPRRAHRRARRPAGDDRAAPGAPGPRATAALERTRALEAVVAARLADAARAIEADLHRQRPAARTRQSAAYVDARA